MPASFADLQLSTPRLRLRPLSADDAPALLALHSDAQVMRYWSSAPWQHIDEAHALIERDRKAMAAGEYLRLALERIETAGLVGACTLFNLHAQCRRAEIGYVLAPAMWGRGLMHEALIALINHGHAALDLNRIEADIDPLNTGSQHTLERLGFAREGFLRERWIVGGMVSDTALYGLLRREWQFAPVLATTPG